MTTTTGYDNPGRVVSTTITKGTKSLGSLAYTDDAASQITKETSVNLGATRTFILDSTGRLTKENTSVYAYDGADQLTTNGATTQGYDAGGQLTTAVTGSTSTAYTFDARGNRTKATTGTAVTTYAYDQANRLTKFTRGTTTATYAYNGDGLRASKTVGTVTTKFVYDTAEGMPLVLTDGASSYLYGPGGTPYAQITTAGVTTYLHGDQLGTVRLITSATGASAGTGTYTAYGTRTTTGTTSPFGYAGQYTDTETGLQWLRARYYDPTTAQFLTVDPLAAATGARYTYAGGNPTTRTDPSGLEWWDALIDQDGQSVVLNALQSFGAGAVDTLATPVNMALDFLIDPGGAQIPAIGNPNACNSTYGGSYAAGAATSALATLATGGHYASSSAPEAISMGDIMANPQVLKGRTPEEVASLVGDTPGWIEGTLSSGSKAGSGWKFSQVNDRGQTTGPQIRWHPGGGHHGEEPYWRAVGPNGDIGGIIR